MPDHPRTPGAGARIRFWANTTELATLQALAQAWKCTPNQAAKRLISMFDDEGGLL